MITRERYEAYKKEYEELNCEISEALKRGNELVCELSSLNKSIESRMNRMNTLEAFMNIYEKQEGGDGKTTTD